MEELLWKIIEESKEGKEYCTAERQFLNLTSILMRYSRDAVVGLESLWSELLLAFKVPEFELLHASKGGILKGGDDAFYLDFKNWILAQGHELYIDFKKRKHVAVLEYVKKHNVPHRELRFENMWYAFNEVKEKRDTGKSYTISEIRNVITLSGGKHRVKELWAENKKVGYRVTFSVQRLTKEGVKTFWTFDIPLDKTLPKESIKILDNAAKGKQIKLEPHGDIYISEEELRKGYQTINLEEDDYAVSFVVDGIKRPYFFT